MADAPDDIEKLVSEVRKTISDNRLFLEKLMNEADRDVSEDDDDAVNPEEDFEEL